MHENGSFCTQQSSATPLGSRLPSDASSKVKNSSSHSSQHLVSPAGPSVESLEVADPVECTGVGNCDAKASTTECIPQVSHTSGACREEEESLIPFDKRPSYLKISRRLQKIRVLPALTACFFSLALTSAICGCEMAIRAVDISSSLSLICSSVVACILAVFAAHKKSHVLLVGLVMLEVLFTLYSVAFASVGIVNVGLLRKRQEILQQDDSMQSEQRENALKINRRMITEQAVFSGLYFVIAAAHCCAAASVNHLRAAVRPFDSRLRRKRQRARAMRKLNVLPPKEEGAKGTRGQGIKAGSFPDELQMLPDSCLSKDMESPSHSSHLDEAEGGPEVESVRSSANSALRSISCSGATSSRLTDENSKEMPGDSHTLA